jgi:hypothetical protein
MSLFVLAIENYGCNIRYQGFENYSLSHFAGKNLSVSITSDITTGWSFIPHGMVTSTQWQQMPLILSITPIGFPGG